ncbi:MAG: hypothetical protein KAH38_02525 [Candidatus Hydrogenedentes bacterium]|nr:hypothetical protein [Candidatus Hydrogenedentota bacterium]
MWASGYGCYNFADEKIVADLSFLDGRINSTFPGVSEAAPIEKRTLTHLQKTHLYLCYLLGLFWWLFGIHWFVVKYLILLFLMINALFLYVFFRQSLNCFFSVIVVCFFAIILSSNFHLDLRDVSKAPFYSGTFLLLALLLKHPVRLRNYLALAFSLAILIGIGMGFRRDMLVLAFFAFPILIFCPDAALLFRHRLWASLIYASILILLCIPIGAFSFHEQGQDNIRVICGFSRESEYLLPLGQTSYIKEPIAMIDEYGVIVSQAAAQTSATMPDIYYQKALDTPDADIQFTGAYLNRLLFSFPFDLTIRAFSAVAYITQGRMLPLSGLFRWIAISTPIIIMLLLLLIASRTPWRATLLLYAFLVFCGYVSLQFQERHFFHLLFVPIWIWAVLIYITAKQVRKIFLGGYNIEIFNVPHLLNLCKAGIAWGTIIGLLAAFLLFSIHRFQASKVLAIRDAYENAERTPLSPQISQWNNDLLLGIDINDCTSTTSFLEHDKLIHKTLMLEIVCPAEPFMLGTSYYGAVNLSIAF